MMNLPVKEKRNRLHLPLGVLILLIGAFLLGGPGAAFAKSVPLNEEEIRTLRGERIEPPSLYIEAHDFEGELASGETGKLAEQKGKFVLLNFWATWCAPCLKEMPDLENVHQSLGPEKLSVVAVAMGEEAERVRKFLLKRPYSFPVYVDTDMSITRLYGVRNIPITYLIDSQGVIIGRALGPRDWSKPELLDFFRAKLAAKSG